MKTLLLVLFSTISGAVLGAFAHQHFESRPTFTALPNGGWTYEHVPMPACPDALTRTIDAPEEDEVDALTITCGVSR